MNAQQAYQLSALLAQTAQRYIPNPNSAQARYSQALLGNAQSGIQAEAIKAAKKREADAKKSKLGGSVGGIVGTVLGIALAPFTGGASLALAGAAGGTAGSFLGSKAMGGDPGASELAGGAATGLMGGVSAGRTSGQSPGPMTQNVQHGSTPSSFVPGAPTPGQAIEGSITSGLDTTAAKLSGFVPSQETPALLPAPQGPQPGGQGEQIGQTTGRWADMATGIAGQLSEYSNQPPSMLPDISGKDVIGLTPAQTQNTIQTLQQNRIATRRGIDREKDRSDVNKYRSALLKNEKAEFDYQAQRDELEDKRKEAESKRPEFIGTPGGGTAGVTYGPDGQPSVSQLVPGAVKPPPLPPRPFGSAEEGRMTFDAQGNLVRLTEPRPQEPPAPPTPFGSSAAGYHVRQPDGTYEQVVAPAERAEPAPNVEGSDLAGRWERQPDGSYKQIIDPVPPRGPYQKPAEPGKVFLETMGTMQDLDITDRAKIVAVVDAKMQSGEISNLNGMTAEEAVTAFYEAAGEDEASKRKGRKGNALTGFLTWLRGAGPSPETRRAVPAQVRPRGQQAPDGNFYNIVD